MKLTGPEIEAQVLLGNIVIDPFDPKRLGPNSYDVTLGTQTAIYRSLHLDCKREITEDQLIRKPIPDSGMELLPGLLYLAHTNEVCGVPADATQGFVPGLEGKSGVGRLGIQIHATAGFGDDGFVGDWTLEITVVHAVRVYAGQLIGQVYFETLMGTRAPYRGNYQGQRGPVASRLWKTFR